MTTATVIDWGNSYTYGDKWCGQHGQYYGDRCPLCPQYYTISTYPPITYTITPEFIKAFTDIISDLKDQLADRDRQIEELREVNNKLDTAVADFTNNA